MLRKKLVADQIQSLKSRNPEKLSILRYILAQIKNKEIDKKSDLNDEEVIFVLRKIAKELNESIEAFTKGKREDLVLTSQNQLRIVTTYLSEELSDDQLKKEIEKIISENQDVYKQNPKAIIGVCIGKLKNQADSSRIVKLLHSIIKL